MDIKLWFKEYLAKYTHCKTDWNYEDGCVLKAAIDLYKVTSDGDYKQFALDYASRPGAQADQALFFVLEETGEERYRQAIEQRMHQLRCADGPTDGKALYAAGPFCMAYEMKCGGMEKVADAVRLFKRVHNAGLHPNGWHLMALVDAIDWCREELYEHYRALVDIFREELAIVLRHREEEDAAMAAYALMKAVRLGLIDPEKYLPIGRRMFEGLSEPRKADDCKGAGPFIMAYSEYLLAN